MKTEFDNTENEALNKTDVMVSAGFTINNKKCYPTCKKNKNCICNKVVLYHKISGNTGVFLKYTYPTGKPKTTVIKLDCGKVYFAPSCEFEQV